MWLSGHLLPSDYNGRDAGGFFSVLINKRQRVDILNLSVCHSCMWLSGHLLPPDYNGRDTDRLILQWERHRLIDFPVCLATKGKGWTGSWQTTKEAII